MFKTDLEHIEAYEKNVVATEESSIITDAIKTTQEFVERTRRSLRTLEIAVGRIKYDKNNCSRIEFKHEMLKGDIKRFCRILDLYNEEMDNWIEEDE